MKILHSLRLGMLAGIVAAAAVESHAAGSIEVRMPVSESSSCAPFAISWDDKWLAAGGPDHTLQIWDLVSKKVQRTIPHPDPHTHVAFSRDGKFVATWSDFGWYDAIAHAGMWEVATGKRRDLPAGDNGVWFPDDISRCITTDEHAGEVVLWDSAARRPMARWKCLPDEHGTTLRSALSHNGQSLATIGHEETWSQLAVRDVKTRSSRLMETHDGLITDFAFSPDDKRVVAALTWGFRIKLVRTAVSTGTTRYPAGEVAYGVRQWDARTGKLISEWKLDKAFPSARIIFSPDGACCVVECTSGSFTAAQTTLRESATGRIIATLHDGIANISANPQIRDVQPPGGAVFLGFAPTGNVLAMARGGPSVEFFDSVSGKSIKTIQIGSSNLNWSTFSHDGKIFGVVGLADPIPFLPLKGFIRLWDLSR